MPPNSRLARTIVLVGLMGAGKTSVGRRLAGRLGVGFIDSDAEIAEAAGMGIPEIFENLGEPAFRDGERKVIARLLQGEPCVLATGGGAFIQDDTRLEINNNATSVWLRASLNLLWERVRGRPGRPLLEVPDPKGVLRRLDRERSPFYAMADVIVDSAGGMSHESMAGRIVEAVTEHDRANPTRPHTFSQVKL